MKKILLFILVFINVLITNGQKQVDYLMKSRALIEVGKFSEAVILLSKVPESLQEYPVLLMRAEAYMSDGDYSRAMNDFNNSNSINPLSGEYGLAQIYALKGDASTAVYHLELSMKSSFRKSEKDILLDPSFSIIEGRPEWRQFWKKEWYGALEKGMAEIEYYISAGNIAEAKQILSGLSGEYPDNNNLIYASALISFKEGKYGESVKSLARLLAEEPGNEKFLRLLASSEEASGNQVGASTVYSKLLDLNIPDPELLILRAECYRKSGETGRAMEDINRYLDLYPGSRKALSFAGKTESAEGDNIKALAFFSENLRLHPNDAECYIDRADAYFVSKSWDWAVMDYSMSLDLQPGNSDVWLNKGIALLGTGKKDDACFDFRQSFNLGNRKATEYISRYCLK